MDFIAGEVLFVAKPLEWTSFDLVSKVRCKLTRALKVKKLKRDLLKWQRHHAKRGRGLSIS